MTSSLSSFLSQLEFLKTCCMTATFQENQNSKNYDMIETGRTFVQPVEAGPIGLAVPPTRLNPRSWQNSLNVGRFTTLLPIRTDT